ncbi:calcineurin-like phosphoesterase [Lichtheimia corymbifera JMRC:FSU:9682]|uniref:Calcineurin-like phosphoesterase n=1 Tax=Lichtheimia corymbifera JMRC:FSU:9682 TaxID=1263082 RepID=A0A068S4S7_9FUNG|nr:calcineurin-like phosphoesterase [Lichtheimia corymbifera JMRC:FSU:9682]
MILVGDSPNELPPKAENKTRFVCVSDTHGKTAFNFPIPDGDVFIHSGDVTKYSHEEEWSKSIAWIASLPHSVKIVTGGNHDFDLDDRFGNVTNKQEILASMEQAGITYLEHELYQLPEALGGFKMFVSPYAPMHLGGAFMPRDLTPYWEKIPQDTQILVTHTPPYGYHDRTSRGMHVGCKALLRKIEAIRPRVCIFGHIHEAHGWSQENGTLMINACICDRRYRASQRPIIFDL